MDKVHKRGRSRSCSRSRGRSIKSFATPARRLSFSAVRSRSRSRSRGRSATTVRNKPKLRRPDTAAEGSLSEKKYSFKPNQKGVGLIARISAPNKFILTNAYRQDSAYSGTQLVFEDQLGSNTMGGPGGTGDINVIFNKFVQPTNPTGALTRRLLMESSSMLYRFTNVNNVDIYVTCYDIRPRYNVGEDDGSTWALTHCDTPMVAWDKGMLDTSIGSTGSKRSTIVGCTPFQSTYFTQFYKVTKVSKHTMQPGATHEHKVSVANNYLMHEEKQQAFTQDRRLSFWTMFVISSQPVNSTANKQNVSTVACSVDVVTSRTYNCKYVPDITPSNTTIDNLQTTITDAEVVTRTDTLAPVVAA